MMTATPLTAGKAETYFDKNEEYYTKHQSNYDRWHGNLAKTRGFDGEVSKEQFDAYLNFVKAQGREKRVAIDCTFSASKSVSLCLASPEHHDNMILAHQRAVARMIPIIEHRYIITRVKDHAHVHKILTNNMAAAEFMHFDARPTKENGYRPDLDLHSHLVIMDDTYTDGKSYHVDFKKLMDDQKILGLTYRGFLAEEVEKLGYEPEVTDPVKGAWELKGFDPEVIEENSNRRKAILKTAEEHNMTDMQAANLYSRETKSKATATITEVMEEKKKELFDSGRVRVVRHEPPKPKGEIENGKHDNGGTSGDTGQASDYEAPPIKRNPLNLGGNEAPLFQGTEVFEASSRMRDLSRSDVVSEQGRVDRILSTDAVSRLAKLQAAGVRDFYLQRQARAERLKEIDEIASKAIEHLSDEKWAFGVKEARERIRAEGVTHTISIEEATAALERQGLVQLGQLPDPEHEGKLSKEHYITMEDNIRKEEYIRQSVERGRGKITSHLLTTEESRERLETIEDEAIRRGETDFRITDGEDGGEQAEAIHHILSCQDQYVCVDGLAGTGKTTMMQRLHWMADQEGITVKGACFTGEAAKGLQEDSGIQSDTIHAMLNQLEKESGIQPPQNTGEVRQTWDFSRVQHLPEGQREIWAIDEAGLVSNNLMYQLQKAAEARGAQVLLLGDPKQLTPVGAGMPMQAMEEAGMATANLTFIRRQKEEELRQTVYESVDGSTSKTYATLKEQGNFHEIAATSDRRAAVVDAMTKDIPIADYKKSLLLVSTNADRRAYNSLIRQRYVDRGELEQGTKYKVTTRDGGREKTETRYFAKGDRVVFKKNDRKLGTKNGMSGTIEAEDGRNITVLTDGGERITVDMTRYNSLEYSYAITEYGAQGMTVDRVVADMSTKAAPQNRNALYVAISRARYKAILYTDNAAKLERQTMKWAKKITSKDFEKRLEELRQKGGIQNNDRYHAPIVDAQAQIDKALASIQIHTLQTAPVESPARAARPQPANESPTLERASSSQEPNLSTSRGFSRTPDKNDLVESPTSPSEDAPQPFVPAENQENPRFTDISDDELEEYKTDPIEYVAKRAPDETALTIETANTISDAEFTELRQFTDTLGNKDVTPFDITLARDGTGHLHVLPYKITATSWKAGDRITFRQLADARHESKKLNNRYLSGTPKGKCAKAQYRLFNSISKGAVQGAIAKGIGGVQSVASTAQDAISIFDPTVRGKDKAKAGAKQMIEAAIQTPVKMIADIFSPPILGILKIPFHAVGGVVKAGIGAAKTAVGLIQETAERDDPQQQQQHPVRTRSAWEH